MSAISTSTLAITPTPQVVPWAAEPGDKPAAAADPPAAALPPAGSSEPARCLHHLGEVRCREGISRRTVARRLGISVGQVELQEQPSSDMLLSDLLRWQKVLGVPVSELLDEPDDRLSPPVELRARLSRVMKTVRAIQKAARQVSMRRLVEMLVDQLIEIMPELRDVEAWHAVGTKRSQSELGQAFFRGRSQQRLNDLDQ